MKFTLLPYCRKLATRGLAVALLGATLPSCVVPPPPPPPVAAEPAPVAVLPRGAVVVRPGVWRYHGVYYRRHPRRGYVVFRP